MGTSNGGSLVGVNELWIRKTYCSFTLPGHFDPPIDALVWPCLARVLAGQRRHSRVCMGTDYPQAVEWASAQRNRTSRTQISLPNFRIACTISHQSSHHVCFLAAAQSCTSSLRLNYLSYTSAQLAFLSLHLINTLSTDHLTSVSDGTIFASPCYI